MPRTLSRRYENDPDETAGRALYRALANGLARAQGAYEMRDVRLRDDVEMKGDKHATE